MKTGINIRNSKRRGKHETVFDILSSLFARGRL